jgi:cell division protein FtsI/penicillin-binding protein 2
MARRVAILGAIAPGAVRRHLPAAVVPSGADRRPVAAGGAGQPGPLSAGQRAARSILDRNGTPIVENRVATVLTLDPKQLPAKSRQRRQRGAGDDRLWRSPGRGVAPCCWCRRPRLPRWRSATGVWGRCWDQRRCRERKGRAPARPAPVRQRQGQGRRPVLGPQLPAGAPVRVPGVSVDQADIRRYPGGVGAAQVVGAVGRSRPSRWAPMSSACWPAGSWGR